MYEYTPLSTTTSQIRLLRIQSVSGPKICCSLDIYNVDTVEGQYYTLSYVWGDQEFTEWILCDGKSLPLTPSLEATLRQLFKYQVSSLRKENESRQTVIHNGDVTDEDILPPKDCLFWIDAICLNQKDPSEIATQIPLMGRVYSAANTTLAYLGPAADGSDFALAEMPQFYAASNRLDGSKRQDAIVKIARMGYDKDHNVWASLRRLIDRPYFERVWILQEAAVSKELVFGCGDRWISRTELLQTYSLLLQSALLNMWISPESNNFTRIDLPMGILQLRQPAKAYSVDQILSVLEISRTRTCRDPEDHIWGVFGLFHPKVQDSVMRYMKRNRLADISNQMITWVELYTQFARWCLRRDLGLRLLIYAPSEERPSDLPSWCPNWNSKLAIPHNVTRGSSYMTGGHKKEGKSAMRSRTQLPNPNKIQLRGFRIDVIKTALGIAPVIPNVGDDIVSTIRKAFIAYTWENECLQLSRSVYNVTKDQVPQAHWRTFVFDAMPGLDGQPRPEERYYVSWKQGLKLLAGESKRLSAELEDEWDALEGEYDQFSQAFGCATIGRRFVSTRGGRVGMGPPDAQEGDVICVFYGGGPLFVIRFVEGGNEAKLIGEAYVHGLMEDDEAFKSPDRGTDEDFVLS